MSNKIEISRELAKRLLDGCHLLGIPKESPAANELRALLAAPVVERQPDAWINLQKNIKDVDREVFTDPIEAGLYSRQCYELTPMFTSPPAPVELAQTCKIGIYGKAYDLPETKRAYTYANQPDNLAAHKLGAACARAIQSPGGDRIDQGLSLLHALEAEGFGVFELANVKELN